jgi:hypothetical protein
MNFEKEQDLEGEDKERNASTVDTVVEMENSGLVQIREKIQKIKEVQAGVSSILAYGESYIDDRHRDDGKIIARDKAFIESEKVEVLRLIDAQYEAIYSELIALGEIKSETHTYKAEDIISVIKIVKEFVSKKKEAPRFKMITRANNIRERVEELVTLTLEVMN